MTSALPLNWCKNQMQKVVVWLSPITPNDIIFIPYTMEFVNEILEDPAEMEAVDKKRLDLTMLFIMERTLKNIEGNYPNLSAEDKDDAQVLLMIQQMRSSRDWMVETLLMGEIPDWLALALLGYPVALAGIAEWPTSRASLNNFASLSPTLFSERVGRMVGLMMQEAREKED
jgi:hypothetical protein